MDLLERYREWGRRRKDAWVAKWAETRKKGMNVFVVRDAFLWAALMTLAMTGADLLFGDPVDLVKILVKFLFFLALGFVLGFVNWNSFESEYLKHHPAAEENHKITGRTT